MRALKSTTTFTSTSMDVDSVSEPVTTASAAMQRSPWHSPVPYLFGGLAAMLGLIAFALLILACSYWKLSGQLNDNDDLENGDNYDDDKKFKDLKGIERVVYEEQFVVIMAGDDQPTCLAMPSRSSSSAAMLFNISNENDEKTATAAAAAAADESVKMVNMELEELEDEEADENQIL